MNIYNYDDNGVFTQMTMAMESPLEPGVFIIPAKATPIQPPAPQEGYLTVFNGEIWEHVLIPVPEPEPAPIPPTLDELKNEKKADLWRAFKKYQQKFVDPEDLTLATALMLQKQPKGTAVAMWVQNLWGAYYNVKTLIENALNESELETVITTPSELVTPPVYTIFELNLEYNTLLQSLTEIQEK